MFFFLPLLLPNSVSAKALSLLKVSMHYSVCGTYKQTFVSGYYCLKERYCKQQPGEVVHEGRTGLDIKKDAVYGLSISIINQILQLLVLVSVSNKMIMFKTVFVYLGV